MNMFSRQVDKGFTLIELLVVIAIIGLLASTVLAAMGSARESGRDARRISDIKQIQTALELFRNANAGLYPCAVPAGVAPNNVGNLVVNMTTAIADAPAGCADITKYLPTIPTDPTFVGNGTYSYFPAANRGSYTLRMQMERNVDTATAGADWCKIDSGAGTNNATVRAHPVCY